MFGNKGVKGSKSGKQGNGKGTRGYYKSAEIKTIEDAKNFVEGVARENISSAASYVSKEPGRNRLHASLSKLLEKGKTESIILLLHQFLSPSTGGHTLVEQILIDIYASVPRLTKCLIKIVPRHPVLKQWVVFIIDRREAYNLQTESLSDFTTNNNIIKTSQVQRSNQSTEHIGYKNMSTEPTMSDLVVKWEDIPDAEPCEEEHQYLNRQFLSLQREMLSPLKDELTSHISYLSSFEEDPSHHSHMRQFTISNVAIDTNEAVIEISFHYPEGHRMRRLGFDAAVDFAKHSKRLLNIASTVAILERTPVQQSEVNCIAVGTVVLRDPEKLSNNNPSIHVEFKGEDFKGMLPLIITDVSERFVVMAQLGDAQFAIPPLLKRLQLMDRLCYSDIILNGAITGNLIKPNSEIEELIDDQTDDSQQQATRNMLNSSYSIIQGPPGTGKTHTAIETILLLLECTNEQVLIITQTNHALDQLLQRLLNSGLDRDLFVRFGHGGESSVENIKIQNVVRNHGGNRYPNQEKIDITTSLRQVENDIKKLSSELLDADDSIKLFKDVYKAFCTKQDLESARLSSIHSEYAPIIKTKRVLGCTCTYLSKHLELFNDCQNLLVEEAAELLEITVAAMIHKNIKRVMCIGDHKQLRPQIQTYNLTVESGSSVKFNMSLFERKVLEGFKHSMLTTQRRMRPEIASLIRKTYPGLRDHHSVLGRPETRGFLKNVFFFNHSNHEGAKESLSTSCYNVFEVHMAVCTVRHLLYQGYNVSDIVVLTPYLAQLVRIKSAIESHFIATELSERDILAVRQLTDVNGSDRISEKTNEKKGAIRISSIDNYQGEESDIVVVSMVRSNKNNNIGHCDSPERMNVMLSRARNTLILLGNLSCLTESGSDTWKYISSLLYESGSVFENIPVVCERHGTRVTGISDPISFTKCSPDGGCDEPCEEFLLCGHGCSLKCHSKMIKCGKCSICEGPSENRENYQPVYSREHNHTSHGSQITDFDIPKPYHLPVKIKTEII